MKIGRLTFAVISPPIGSLVVEDIDLTPKELNEILTDLKVIARPPVELPLPIEAQPQ